MCLYVGYVYACMPVYLFQHLHTYTFVFMEYEYGFACLYYIYMYMQSCVYVCVNLFISMNFNLYVCLSAYNAFVYPI